MTRRRWLLFVSFKVDVQIYFIPHVLEEVLLCDQILYLDTGEGLSSTVFGRLVICIGRLNEEDYWELWWDVNKISPPILAGSQSVNMAFNNK